MKIRVLASFVLASLLILIICMRFTNEGSIIAPEDQEREPAETRRIERTREAVERSRERVHTYSTPASDGLRHRTSAALDPLPEDAPPRVLLPATELLRIINEWLAERDQWLQKSMERSRNVAPQSPRAMKERRLWDQVIATLDAGVAKLRAGEYVFSTHPPLAALNSRNAPSKWVVVGETMVTGSPRYVWVDIASQGTMRDR